VIPPLPVASVRCGLDTSPFRSATNPCGTVTTAATRPEASCCAACFSDIRTISTFLPTSRIRLSMLNDCPATVTRCGMPSLSTNATRGFALA
jgi:hypothetical protein